LLAGQQFLGEARTAPQYRLFDSGPYPCMILDRERGVAVQGELWRVDDTTLARLDEFEEVDHLFIRREIEVAGMSTPAFAYLYLGDVSGMNDSGDSWPARSSRPSRPERPCRLRRRTR